MRKINQGERIALRLISYTVIILFAQFETRRSVRMIQSKREHLCEGRKWCKSTAHTQTSIDAITMSQVLVIGEKLQNSRIFMGAKCNLRLFVCVCADFSAHSALLISLTCILLPLERVMPRKR